MPMLSFKYLNAISDRPELTYCLKSHSTCFRSCRDFASLVQCRPFDRPILTPNVRCISIVEKNFTFENRCLNFNTTEIAEYYAVVV